MRVWQDVRPAFPCGASAPLACPFPEGRMPAPIAGYSAYFVDLSPDLQDDLIARTEHGAF